MREQFQTDLYLPETYDPTDDNPFGPRERYMFLQDSEGDYLTLAHVSPPQPLSVLTHRFPERVPQIPKPGSKWVDHKKPESWRIADVLVLLYAVNSRQSFDELVGAVKERGNLKEGFDVGDGLQVVVVATQADLPRESWEVSEEEGRELARSLGCGFQLTSALTGDGVKELIEGYLVKVIELREENQRKEKEAQSPQPATADRGATRWKKLGAAVKQAFRKVR